MSCDSSNEETIVAADVFAFEVLAFLSTNSAVALRLVGLRLARQVCDRGACDRLITLAAANGLVRYGGLGDGTTRGYGDG